MADTKTGSLAKAQSLLTQATTGLLKIRNTTAPGYDEDADTMQALHAELGALGDQLDLGRQMAMANGADLTFQDTVIYPVAALYESVRSDLDSGMLPRLPEDPQDVPGTDPYQLQMQAMREEAAEYEAEDATNGYEEVPSGESPERDTQPG